MNRPAVPNYITSDFNDCPPGHRFNLYFPIWRDDWQFDNNGKTTALLQSLKLNSSKQLLVDINKRQKTLAETLPGDTCYIMEAHSTAPFATGLGLEHPIENGFAFLSPYGLPYLAGSGVKGVLRRSAEELREEDERVVSDDVIEALFGHEDANDARRGALSFWDVFPIPPKDELTVEIMTPHFTNYYQGKGTPNDAGKPTPLPFMAVPAGSQFRFVITCETTLLTDAVPPDRWKTDVGKIIAHAFDWLGFGAKTAVGYGQMYEAPTSGVQSQGANRVGQEVKPSPSKMEDLLSQIKMIECINEKSKIENILKEASDKLPSDNKPVFFERAWQALSADLRGNPKIKKVFDDRKNLFSNEKS